jgi:A/G-specific adenine glycosylase
LQQRLLDWFRRHQRKLPWRATRDPYRIWVAEVMLQQTQVQTVLPFYRRFLERFPDVACLARADLGDVLKAWEGLGYYARARNLHRAAGHVVACHRGRVPSEPAAFRRLPGAGEYITAAVQSIAFGHPLAVVDGNVKRVLARLACVAAPVNLTAAQSIFRKLAAELLAQERPGDFNQAMMELGALVCRPRDPDCRRCPLVFVCRAYQAGKTDRYPRRRPAAARPAYDLVIGVVVRNGRMLIVRRPTEGLLGGLWEFPAGPVEKGQDPAAACVCAVRHSVGLTVQVAAFLTRLRHAYTHFRITADVFRCRCRAGRVQLREPAAFRWVRLEEIDRLPFTGATRKFIPLLQGRHNTPAG